METIQIKKENALKAYKHADKSGKKLLSTLFGNMFSTGPITDRVKTFEDACEILGIDTQQAIPDAEEHVQAYVKLTIIARALNEGWLPDWDNSNQKKYYPWFKMASGFGFSVHGYDYTYANTGDGSRLCFKSVELAEYAGKQFESIYKQYLTI